MNPEREQYQMPMDETMDDLALGGTKSNVAECQPSQRQSRDSDPHESMVEKVERSKILKTLMEQQEYEDMKKTSWADLMEEEEQKSTKVKEVAAQETQPIKTACVTLSSDEEFPSLSKDVKQSNVEWRKTSACKSRKTKSRPKGKIEFTEVSADQTLKTEGQVHGKPQRRAFKREKIQSVQPYSAATSDDEEVSTSSKYQKKRRKDIQKEKIPHEASSSKSGFENASLSVSKRSSRESSPGSTSSVASTLRIKKGWSEPKLGWCRDETVLARRSKEIEKAKEKSVYAKYLAKVPRHARTKEMPKTPNKYIQYSRRSWDKQVRLWKRQLYDWADEEPSQSCLSLNESTNDEISESGATSSLSFTLMPDENASASDQIKVEQDAAASLLGYLDIDTRTNTLTVMKTDDESTLKGSSRNVLGPRDFSQL